MIEFFITLLLLTVIGSITFKAVMYIAELEEQEKTKVSIICGYDSWIGYLERLIIYWCMLLDIPILIFIIIFMKVIVRINDRSDLSSNYILLGTLFNIAYSLLLVVIVVSI